MKKAIKYSLLLLGTTLIGYGSWKTAEYFLGITRLKFATYKKIDYDVPPTSSEEVE